MNKTRRRQLAAHHALLESRRKAIAVVDEWAPKPQNPVTLIYLCRFALFEYEVLIIIDSGIIRRIRRMNEIEL